MVLEKLKFHHIGIAVSDFEQISSYYCSIGYKRSNESIIRDELQVVDLMLLIHDVHPNIELVKPFNVTGTVVLILKG